MTVKRLCPYCGKEWIGTSNRRAKKPLDPDAVAAANLASRNNCKRLTSTDGKFRSLTMSKDDYFCRRRWMDAYLEAIKKKHGSKGPSKPKVDPKNPVMPCKKAILVVKVTDYDGKPIKDAIVYVVGIGGMPTEEKGYADYGQVAPGTYDITAEKNNFSPAPKKPPGKAKKTEILLCDKTNVVKLRLFELPIIKKENVIFIGSEEKYDLFWLKMMFVAPAFKVGDKGMFLRKSDKSTVVLVDVGYTRLEKLPLETLKRHRGFNIVALNSSNAIVKYLNNRPQKKKEKTLLQDVVFFCHGEPGKIALNYKGRGPDVDITHRELAAMKKDIFISDGKIYSYACRTGISGWYENFKNDKEADPKNSLAQKMADHFKVHVHAFLSRSDYGSVLREKSDSKRIAKAMREGRKTRNGKVIDIPPDHEGLPHPGLAKGGPFSSTDEEGTDEYALWRKKGAIRMPQAGSTPTGLSKMMRRFTPSK